MKIFDKTDHIFCIKTYLWSYHNIIKSPMTNAKSNKNFFVQYKEKYQAWATKIVEITGEQPGEEKKYGKNWDRLGYHRPVGRYIHSFGLLIPQAVFGLLLLPLLKFTELRFPELGSFEAAAGGVFGALYSILDLELGPTIDRFVPQYAVSEPRKALQYVSFFIRYQMWSGLIQIAFVSIFTFMYIIPYTNFTYLAFFILFINQKQYPAILSTFYDVIGSFQHGDKANWIVFYRASVLEPITRLIGGLLGLWYGLNNPIIGEMMGMALGFAVGGYVDDFLVFLLGMFWLSKIIDKYGIRIWEMYGQTVPQEVWKSALSYSARLMPRQIFGALMGFFSFLLTFQNLYGYSSFTGIFKVAGDLRKFVGWSDDILNGSQPSFSEAYNNGKINLTKYYIGEGLKYNMLFFMILGSFNVFALPVILRVALGVFLNENWEMVAVIVPLQILLYTLHAPYDDVCSKMIYLSGHPEFHTIWGIISTFINLFFTWYFLAYLRLGWVGVLLQPLPTTYLGLILKWIFMNKTVIHLDKQFWKDIAWQCFVAPLLAGGVLILWMELILQGLWPLISWPFEGDLILIPAIIAMVLLLLGAIFIYFPLVSFFGFWDERSLNTFRRAVALSGPSIWLIWPLYKIFNHFYQKSPFKKQSYSKLGEISEPELKDLMEMRWRKFVDYAKAEDKDLEKANTEAESNSQKNPTGPNAQNKP